MMSAFAEALSMIVAGLALLALIAFLLSRLLAFLGERDPGTIIGKRQRRGECTNCGYDLTGNESGVCPECGTPVRKK